MAEQKEQVKAEVVAELRAEHMRWVRNAMALGGLALIVGCTFALSPLVGGIVAGVAAFGIGLSGIVLSRRTEPTQEKESDA